jgi:hydroxyacylglutathione hydrolase
MAGLLYDSIFKRILPLGDGVLLCPAHGSGSVCGGSIGERTWTTIGLERRLNPRLQRADRESFIEAAAQPLPYPPYFTRMERMNVEGPPLLRELPLTQLLAPDEFERLLPEAEVIDTREAVPFGAAHVPGSLSLWLAGLPAFAGWFLPYDRPLLLVGEEREAQTRSLRRLGYDQIPGILAGGMQAWQEAGKESGAVGLVTVQEVRRRHEAGEQPWILDVRAADELEASGALPGSHHIPLHELARRMEEIPQEPQVLVLCGSGHRSMIAASLLVKAGWRRVSVIEGGMTAWSAAGYPAQCEPAAVAR